MVVVVFLVAWLWMGGGSADGGASWCVTTKRSQDPRSRRGGRCALTGIDREIGRIVIMTRETATRCRFPSCTGS